MNGKFGGKLAFTSSRGQRTAEFVLVIMSIGIALLIFEAATRAFYPAIREASWYYYNTQYGMRHRSNMDQLTNLWGDGQLWQLRTNRRGFRGEDWPDTPPIGIRRVIVAGDSFTFANAVEESDSFVKIAEVVAREKFGQHWEIINLGVSAWSPQNVLAYLSTEGAPIGGSCLILAFFEGNDVIDGLTRPLYQLENGVLRLQPTTQSQESRLAKVRNIARHIPGYDFLIERSQLFNLVRKVILENLRKDKRQHTSGEARNQVVSGAELENALAMNEKVLNAIADLARTRFGSFGIILIPMLGQITGEKSDRAMPNPIQVANESHKSVLSWARTREIPVINLQEQIRRNKVMASQLYFTQDFHLNKKGNEFVGQVVGEQLLRICKSTI